MLEKEKLRDMIETARLLSILVSVKLQKVEILEQFIVSIITI